MLPELQVFREIVYIDLISIHRKENNDLRNFARLARFSCSTPTAPYWRDLICCNPYFVVSILFRKASCPVFGVFDRIASASRTKKDEENQGR